MNRTIITLECTDVQIAELLHHQEQADHHGQAAVHQVLPAVPQAHGFTKKRSSATVRPLVAGSGPGRSGDVESKASSSNGRAAVSKTACWGFESLLACHLRWTQRT